ncbi:MAG: Alpha-D-GlcNAc alpha-1,2-L-rhamnosyltransferase (EC [uncultured Sulfurovum sp.]|uniref:Alpha-D-GlcNAc alpha-1,2-L-rhamnosyltransferase (EC) n=1 Tax=uncultured Sulfurovum sp. TaxID=269237 RepID=A0A6S6T6X3_9BACT|nr:MAG: Alpha-D-GlcNAc alpha-1,2-L-rhamnosyltransferase (EC [uncultured Sulfurovum sp.]
MKIIVLGTRGIPYIQGGVETHCQELYPRLVKLGFEVTLITRTPYVQDKSKKVYKGVKLKHLFTPQKKSIEAITHTLLGIFYARLKNPDILHIHSIGPSLMVPLARLLGLKVLVTNHGPDYERQKWGKLAKKALILGEKLGTKYAHQVIVISEVIRNILQTKYQRGDTALVYNGVTLPIKSEETDYIETLGLEKNNYMISVGRFVEEKGLNDLIEAYGKINTEVKLVFVGDADHKSQYSEQLKKSAKENGIILTGFIKGKQLNEIFSHAKLFLMPSYHEGLPIALLEAMSYNLDVLVSDIPANLEVTLDKKDYFEVGNIEKLSEKLEVKLRQNENRNFSSLIIEKYNWNIIAQQTKEVYLYLIKGKSYEKNSVIITHKSKPNALGNQC